MRARADRVANDGDDWWRGATIYQIYPRSFMDASGDGVGDLAGVRERLDYVAGLGVDAIWLSPFFPSPMDDFGYDVSDYRGVDPLFGTLDDFDRVVEAARARGLKVIIDQVLSHTSDRHPWFAQSRRDRDNPKADWYVWAEPKDDGSPPNNWLSVFGGAAWQWDTRRRQYYLHNFLTSQPDLNFHNPQVRRAQLDNVEFWLRRGVDGFRLDTANFYFHDAGLRDNPARPAAERGRGEVRADNPYGYQYHRYDKTRPENVDFLRALRALLNRYPGSTTVGEIAADDPLAVMAEYTAGDDRLHMAYTFDLLGANGGAAHIRATVETLEARLQDGWPCWSLSNHDVARVVTRWGGYEHPSARSDAYAKMLTALLLSLRGSACLYQGEELGLTEAELEFEQLRDPYGIAFWPEFKGRDGCRTPLPWRRDGVAAGFSAAEPWLPVPDAHRLVAVAEQDHVPGSVLNGCRRFLKFRAAHPALRRGAIAFIDAPEPALCFIRDDEAAGERLLICFNLGGVDDCRVPLPAGLEPRPLDGHGFAGELDADGGAVTLPAYGALFAALSP